MDRPPEDRPTLLVFTLGARWESRRRQLLPAALSSLEDRLHQACLEETLAAGRAAGCRLEVSSPLAIDLPEDVHRRPQHGADFGSRLAGALGETLTDRGGAVVLVGSDVPDLGARHVGRVLEILDEDSERVVIGPSPDGGIYLLAVARPLDVDLSRIRWRCRETLRSLERALAKEGREVVMLPPLADLDQRVDLERWLATAAAGRTLEWRRLIVRLTQVLADLRHWRRAAASPRIGHRVALAAPLRGPPCLAGPA